MSRSRASGQAVLLVVVIVLVVMSSMAWVGSPVAAGQHSAKQPEPGSTAHHLEMNSDGINTTSPTSNEGWTMSRANAANTNYINTTGPTNPITVRWTFETDANTFKAGPLVKDGTVYFATRYYKDQKGAEPDGKLYAVDAWTGEVRWTFVTSFNDFPSAIAVLRDTVYVGGNNGNVYALDAETGDEFWSFRSSKVFGLTVANRTLYVRARHTVYALGALRAEEKWQFKAKGGGRPTGLAVKNGTAYVSTKGGHVYGLDAETAAVSWETNVTEDFNIENEDDMDWLKSPVVANGMVFVTHQVHHTRFSDSNFYALDAQTGEARWSRTEPRADAFSTPSVRGDTIYFSGKHLLAVNATTGAVRWSEPSIKQTPVLLNDIGYFSSGGADGALYTLNPSTGTHHARFSPPQFNNSWDRWRSGKAVLNRSLYTGVGIDEPGTSARSDRTIFYALGTPEFNYTNLSVTPSAPEINETVNVTATVRNTGTGPGTFNATLSVNGNVTNATTDRLAPRTNTTVTFPLVFQQNGTYTVGIGNLTQRIAVGDVALATTPTAQPPDETGNPTQTSPSEATSTVAGQGSTPTATTTSGTAPGFGVGVSIVMAALVAGLLGRRHWN